MLAYLPASVAISWVSLPKNLTLSGISGSIWSGKINQLSIDGRQLDDLRWQMTPLQLLSGKVAAHIQVGSRATLVNAKANVAYGMSGLALSDVRFEAPVAWLIGNSRLPFRTKAQGEVTVLLTDFTQGAPWCSQLDGKAFASGLQVDNQFGQYPLGQLQLAMSCTDGQVMVNIDETTNGLGLSGSATVGEQMQVALTAKIRETNTMPDDLKKALTFLGQPDSQGYYPLKFNGRVPGL
nr:type II secretion system protein N [Shewanella sp. NIFS-20-20]